MQKTSVIYIDDNETDIIRFQESIENLSDVIYLGNCSSASEAYNICIEKQPDIVSVGLSIKTSEGLWLINKLEEQNFDIVIVHDELESEFMEIELQTTAFINKPIENTKLEKVINDIKDKKYNDMQLIELKEHPKEIGTNESQKRIFINTQKQIIILQLSEIVFVEAKGSYSHFHMLNGKIIVSGKNLKSYEPILLKNIDFKRIHRTYIINEIHLISIDKKKLHFSFQFSNEMQIAVATYRKDSGFNNMLS